MAKKAEQQQAQRAQNIETNGIYVLMDQINHATCRDAIKWIMNQNLSDNPLPQLTLIINSVGLGLIASCGFLIFIAGEKGKRILTPNTSILSHQYSWGSRGKEHELYARVKEFELSTDRMIKHYKKCLGMTEAKIKEILLPPQDVWLSAEEAKRLKICDKIEELY